MTESTTLNYNYTRGQHLQVNDSRNNSIRITPGAIPAITCDGKPQTIDINRTFELAQRGNQMLERNFNEAAKLLSQLPPSLPGTSSAPPRTPSLDDAIKNLAGIANTVQHTSGTITYEGQSPLSQLCQQGQAAGVIR